MQNTLIESELRITELQENIKEAKSHYITALKASNEARVKILSFFSA